jgi:Tfp pilus assembly protein PilP
VKRLHLACVALAFLVACGDDSGAARSASESKEATAKAAKPATPTASASAGAKKGKKGGKLWTYPKVDDTKYRRAFAAADFEPDLTGDVNRDPFRSYVLEDTAPTSQGKLPQEIDECERRTVAQSFGLRELKLIGVVKKGTTAYALFTDSQRDGHIAKRGDCLSKDRARIKEIGATNMIIEIRGQAAPGAPAPEPREEEWRLHPEQLDLRQEPIEIIEGDPGAVPPAPGETGATPN